MAFSPPKLHLFQLFNSIFNMIELAKESWSQVTPSSSTFSWWVWKSDLWLVWGSRMNLSRSLCKWAAANRVESKRRMQSLSLEGWHRGIHKRGQQMCRKRTLRHWELDVLKLQWHIPRLVPPTVSTELLTFDPIILAGMLSWVSQPWTDPAGHSSPWEVALKVWISYLKIILFPFPPFPLLYLTLNSLLSFGLLAWLQLGWQGWTQPTLIWPHTLIQTK